MHENGEEVNYLRIKVISFKDYEVDQNPMVESRFYSMPEEIDDFCEYIDSIEAEGGGDFPKNILGAIVYALRSDWSTEGNVKMQRVMVLSGSEPLELWKRGNCPKYPKDMPKDLKELKDLWYGRGEEKVTFDPTLIEMHVFDVPECDIWKEISKWRGCIINYEE